MAKAKKRKVSPPLRVLYVSSEAFPLIKTGGLADVSHTLPNALAELGVDIRVLLPAYRAVLQQVEDLQILGWLDLGALGETRVLQAYHPEFQMPIWLVDHAGLFDREGNPYLDPNGRDWHDNPMRFSAFSKAAALMGIDALGMGWRPGVVHAQDWQAALTHAFLAQEGHSPRRIYTIHNLAYDCQFNYAQFQALRLPPHWWSMENGILRAVFNAEGRPGVQRRNHYGQSDLCRGDLYSRVWLWLYQYSAARPRKTQRDSEWYRYAAVGPRQG